VSVLVPAVSRAAFRRGIPGAAQLMLDWEAIVGPALAAVTEPRRLVSGTLTIACAGPIAMELQHMAVELMGRINTTLGAVTVRALRFVQVGGLAALGSRPMRETAARPSPQAQAAAQAAVADLPAGPLRDALTALGSRVLSRGATRRR
jgi:hypothetical protein